MLNKTSSTPMPESPEFVGLLTKKVGRDNAGNNSTYTPASFPFIVDSCAMLKKIASGIAGKHIFEGAGNDILRDFKMASSYYPYHDELDLMLNNPGFYTELAYGGVRRPGPLVAAEMGAGGQKTLVFLAAVHPDICVLIDHAMDPLLEAANMIREHIADGTLPPMKIEIRLADFNTDDFRLPEAGRIILGQFGIPFGNRAGFKHKPFPMESCVHDVKHYMSNLQGVGDRLIVSVDYNDRAEEILDCYSGKMHEDLSMIYLEKVKQGAPVSKEFDPSNFRPTKIWVPENHLAAIGYNVKDDTRFKVEGDPVLWSEGEDMIHTNSYRFTPQICSDIATRAQAVHVGTLAHSKKRIHQNVYAPSL